MAGSDGAYIEIAARALLGEDGDGLRLARTLARDGTARALADYRRFSDAARVSWAEPSLVERYLRVLDEPDPDSLPETALSAMILGMADTHEHWVLLLTSMAAYELGLSKTDTFVGKEAVPGRDGAAALVADALRRGSACTDDFSVIDHLELAPLPLEDVRARFGVPPLDPALRPTRV